ncbi:fatty acid synthase 3 [Lycorma delicatula]|uniref:fatty acid synthase 3 n=1 Tax=Lycorma delicatula TaxID=130591 RepID=UPI003F516585
MVPTVLPNPAAALKAGRRLANPGDGEEVVITGTAGFFPDSENVADFAEKLFNKVDLITDDDRRWKLEHPEIPQRTGKLLQVSKFDAAFFGVHYKQAHTMDPMCRMLLEKSYEAVIDAGYNPRKLRGTKTGVFIGACFSESEKTWFYEKLQVNGFGITGCSRAMLANRISYWLGINGPSYTVDSACSSSLYALEHAYKSIRDGHCDSAIVGGCNLCLHPYVSLQFARLGVLSLDGRCKSFDEAANGYCRSEAISVVFVQKRKDARRIYATVVHAKTNCDGFKEQGITFPSGPLQQKLLEEFYEECQVEPSKLAWVEAHGTGTRVGDPEEVKALENVFCPGRTESLLVGSVKSNIGHSEPASGLCSVTKVIIAMETGYIPPNINFNTPRSDIEALQNGKIKVVTSKTLWNGGMVGINSFGFGGANCHVLLKWNENGKINGGLPADSLPRLVPTSGRTEIAVDKILTDIESRPLDAEYVKLYHEIHVEDIPGHIYRGYTLINKNSVKKVRDIQYYAGNKREVWFVFSGMGSQWPGMALALMEIPIFAASIQKSHDLLKPKGVDLIKVITDQDPKIFDNILHSFIGIAAVQVGLVDILKAIAIEPDRIIGHSVGELGCAYADGCFTAEQVILSAYYRGLASLETKFIKGAMAAIGLGYNMVKMRLPSEVEVACHNGPDSSTISGPVEEIKKFVSQLQSEGIFAREVKVSNIPYHSKHIAKAGPKLLKYLKQVIPKPSPRSNKWVSTSVKESDWNLPIAQTSSAEYHTNNLLSPVLFEEGCRHIPKSAITIEIAPHALLQAILRRSLGKDCINTFLTQKGNVDVSFLFSNLGKLFTVGLNPIFSNLYPEVPLPVSRGTPMIAPLICWEHSEDWYVTSYRMQEKIKSGERLISFSLKDDEMEFISGHVIDGRNLFPATGYLVLVWETFGMMRGELYTEVPVVFENVRFQRATNIPKDGSIEFVVMIQKGSGTFEVVEGGAAIVSGRVYAPGDINKEMVDLKRVKLPDSASKLLPLNSKDIYKELRQRGYNYKGLFRGLVSSDNTGTVGTVAWNNNWVAFMDSMLQMQILQEDTRALFVPTAISKLSINIKKHVHDLFNLPEDKKELPVYLYKESGILKSGGVEFRGIKASAISRRKPLGEPILERYQFIPYINYSQEMDLSVIVRIYVHIVLENLPSVKVKTIEVLDSFCNPDGELLSKIIVVALGDLPLIQADCQVLSSLDNSKIAESNQNISFEDKKLGCDQSAILVVASNLFVQNRSELLKNALATIKDGAFILAREKVVGKIVIPSDLDICADLFNQSERLILLRKKVQESKTPPVIIKISQENFSWVPTLQAALKTDDAPIDQKIILYAQNEPLSGLLGLLNCLRKEPGGLKTRCVLITDENIKRFSIDDMTYKSQLSKDLAVNVYKNGQWGSYRHLQLFDDKTSNKTIKVYHSYINQLTRGDISSLTWCEGSIKPNLTCLPQSKVLVSVYYSALNFRDIMTATGKLANEIMVRGRIDQECVQGIEYSGKDSTGRRVMGLLTSKAISSVVLGDKLLMWDIPDDWTLEDAATVPIVYGTALWALIVCGRMKKGESILIHAGSGGVGQAAINLALHAGCTVFTTVGTPEKVEFIRKHFPQISEKHIGNSRDTSFEQLIMKETGGRGVDLVLNSLAEEKLQASVRCLATGGRFLEIGKFDMANNNPLGMETFLKETSFHGVLLDNMFFASAEEKKRFHTLFKDNMKTGGIKPLTRTVFPTNEVQQAFRYMAAGKHIGKVLIQIREEEPQKSLQPKPCLFDAKPYFHCDTKSSYIIIGGLGGFGLELADWMILRGAKKLVLASRTGVKTGYQAMRIRLWESYGVTVKISTEDITTEEGVKNLLKDSNSFGPVAGIFNLAVVLKDGLFENLTETDFVISAGPKACATIHLDKLSRVLCPNLQQFVVFSSVSCGRGNAGQTNYGMSNSVMERVCELRRSDNLPAVAIQWGAIGDVGLVAEMQEDNFELVIGGTLQQRITSCLELLDVFLKGDDAVVASMIVAEKRSGGGSAGNIVDTVVSILGLRDLKTVSLHSTLAELGMDSMMAVEIKQTLEREFEVFLTPQDIRGMTFSKLQDVAKASESNESKPSKSGEKVENELPHQGMTHLLRMIGDELVAGKPVVRLPSLANSSVTEEITTVYETVFMIPGIEGVSSVMESLAKNLFSQALCLQFNYEVAFDTVGDLAESLLPHILQYLKTKKTFNLIGYSFGGMVAMELLLLLEKRGYSGKTILVDSSPDFLKVLTTESLQNNTSEINLQVQLLLRFVALIHPHDTTELKEALKNLPDWKSRLDFLIDNGPDNTKYSKKYQKLLMNAVYHRVKSILTYEGIKCKSIKSQITLIRPSDIAVNMEEDYELSKYTLLPVPVIFVEGNHVSILDNKKTAELINNLIDDESVGFKKEIMSKATDCIASLHQQIKHL